jgi:NitT/TauT family transport system ATP-binding protein
MAETFEKVAAGPMSSTRREDGSARIPVSARGAASHSTGSLSIRDLTVSYDKNVVIDGLTIEVEQNQILSVVGRSGCGKTTLLNAVAGFVPVTAGQIMLAGQRISRPGPDRMVVLQDFDQLFPWKSAKENIAYAIRLSSRTGRAASRAEADQWLSSVGMTHRAQAYPSALSGGQKQRVALARALAVRPRIILLDEPFASVDAQTRGELQPFVRGIIKENRVTGLLVTHDIEESLLVGDRVIVLGLGGSIKEDLAIDRGRIEDPEYMATQQKRIRDAL